MAVVEGKAVPAFTLEDAEGKKVSLKDFQGKRIILLSDPTRTMMENYEAYGEKMMYGKKVTGVIRSTVLIDEAGKVIKHWARVAKAEAHPGQVLKTLNAM